MINKVILMGRLTKDPELRHTNSGTPVCSFNIAVDNGYGEHRQTDFINCVAWNKTAEFVSKHFAKGKMMIVSDGRVTTDNWEDDEGRKHYKTYVLAKDVTFGERKKQQDGSGSEADEAFTPLLDDGDLPF